MQKTILVAEDEKFWQEIVQGVIKDSFPDVQLVVVATREEALTKIVATDIALVITDLRMPDDGDGEAVVLAAQEKGIKVIVLSGTVDDLSADIREKCFSIFKKRDFSHKGLMSKIEECIGS